MRVETAGEKQAANAFIRGDALSLPAGVLKVVVGGEFNRDKLDSNKINYGGLLNSRAVYSRNTYAAFAEADIPILPALSSMGVREPLLDATVAGRLDHDEYFGGKTTPQFGALLRPLPGLDFRATDGKAFKAPTLLSLFAPQTSAPLSVRDPRNGGAVFIVPNLEGGDVALKPETGKSRTFGVTYTNDDIEQLRVAITNWQIQ